MTTFKFSQVALMMALALPALSGCAVEASLDAENQAEAMETEDFAVPNQVAATVLVPVVAPVPTGERAAEGPTKPGVDLTRDPEPQPWNDPNVRKFR